MIVALRNQEWLSAGTVMRGLLAGTVWGVAMGVGLPLMAFMSCGTICLSDIAITTAISVPAGIVTIGPLAALRRSPVLQPV